jgi:hypothetical protein
MTNDQKSDTGSRLRPSLCAIGYYLLHLLSEFGQLIVVFLATIGQALE